MSKKKIHKFFLILSISLFLINPIIIYALTNEISTTLFIFIFAIIINFVLTIKLNNNKLISIFIFLAQFIFICITSEFIFRNNFKHLCINNLYERQKNYYFNKPNLNKILDDKEYQTIYRTDDHGYRIGKDFQTVSDPHWLFIGDSYTQGAQVNFEELFTSIIANYSPKTRILNAGISGFGIIDEYEYLINQGVQFKPTKLIIQLSVLNDFEDISPRKINLDEYLIEKSELYRFYYYNYKISSEDPNVLGRWVTPFFQSKYDNINYNILFKESSVHKEQTKRNLYAYLDKITNIASKMNAKLYIILIPTKEQVYPDKLKEVLDLYKIDSTQIDLNYASKIISSKSKNNFKLIDPLQDFKSDSKMLYFDIDEHLNQYGHAKLAEIVYRELRK